MAIYKRGKYFWFDFILKGERYQHSTHLTGRRVAEQMEGAFKTALLKGEVGIVEKRIVPALKDFAQRFIDAIQVRCAAKPKTIDFYSQQLARLLEFEPLATARVDTIDEALIQSFVEYRSQRVSPASVNRALATLRRLLRLAQDWRVIDRVPRIRLLPGERNREFILSRQQERNYLEMAPQPLGDIAMLILDTGLRIGEALALEWQDVHIEAANGATRGYIHVHDGKSRFARRNIPLTERVRLMLAGRKAQGNSPWVFGDASARPMLNSSLDHLHKKLREALKLPADFVLHSLRHTYGTRLGESRADAFTIMRLMGHSSVTVTQRYVHPTPEAIERAVDGLEAMNGRTAISLPKGPKMLPVPTFSTTAGEVVPVSH